MLKRTSLLFSFLGLGLSLSAQNVRDKVQDGNQNYSEGAFDQAEINYREALKNGAKHQSTINFNLGDALYKQERFEEAFKAFEESLSRAESKEQKAAAYHNLGNSYLKQQKLEEAIKSYKQALINNPSDEETRYNLAKALEQKKEQEKQQQQQDKEKDQDQKDQDKDNQDQQDKDQNQDDQQNKDQDPKDQQDQGKDQEDKNQDPKDQNKQDQKQADMNRQNAERLLQALDRDEEKLQKELMKKKIKAKPLKSTKDW